MEDYIFSTKVPFDKELDDETSEVFKTLMNQELDKSMNKIKSEMNQFLQNYTIILYYINSDKNNDWPPKYLKINVKFSLNGEEGDSPRNIGFKILGEIENPIRHNILNAMENNSRLEYKPVDEPLFVIVCS